MTRGRRVVQERYSKKYGAAQATMGQLEFELLDQRSSSDFVSLALRWRLSWPRPSQKNLPRVAALSSSGSACRAAGSGAIHDASM